MKKGMEMSRKHLQSSTPLLDAPPPVPTFSRDIGKYAYRLALELGFPKAEARRAKKVFEEKSK